MQTIPLERQSFYSWNARNLFAVYVTQCFGPSKFLTPKFCNFIEVQFMYIVLEGCFLTQFDQTTQKFSQFKSLLPTNSVLLYKFVKLSFEL